ncbi:MAG: hypothetical protein CMG00_08500 [Candidatus Marinimicrobia bacterium]|nr:hypothetical protein [Candidatus Neomarinimicrobiota bacterium]
MKKILILSLISFFGFLHSQNSISLSDVSLNAGDSINVDLAMSNESAVYGFQFKIQDDPDFGDFLLEQIYVSDRVSPAWTIQSSIDENDGSITVLGFEFPFENPILPGEGPIISLGYKSTGIFDADITLSLDQVIISDISGLPLDVSFDSCVVSVDGDTPPDVFSVENFSILGGLQSVQLGWYHPFPLDVSGYNIYQDGQVIATIEASIDNNALWIDTDLLDGEDYCYQVAAFDSYSESELSEELCTQTDYVLDPPLGVYAQADNSNQNILVSWSEPGSEGNYRIVCSAGDYPSEVSWELLDANSNNAISGGAPFSQDDVLLPNGLYTLNMIDSWGDGWNGAVWSLYDINDNELASCTFNTGNFDVCEFNLGSESINSRELAYYTIFRSGGNDPRPVEIAQVDSSSFDYLDESTSNNTEYCYMVTASYSYDGETFISVDSNQSCAQWILMPPMDFNVTGTNGRLELAWNGSTSSALVGYNINKLDAYGVLSFLTFTEDTFFYDTQTDSDTEYCYNVVAIYDIGESASTDLECGVWEITSPDDLQAEGLDSSIYLTWGSPIPGGGPQIGGECLVVDPYSGQEITGTTDCNGQCVDSAQLISWIDDGFCDDGTYGMYLNCDEFDCDGGDCLFGGECAPDAEPYYYYSSSSTVGHSAKNQARVFSNIQNTSRDLTSFKIYKNGYELVSLPANTFEYYDYDVINLSSYCYSIIAIYDEGESSFNNNEVCAIPIPGEAPNSMQASALESSISLQWEGQANSYNIYRRLNIDESYLELIDSDIINLFYEDLTAEPDVGYCYSVTGIYTSGESLPSDEDCAIWEILGPNDLQAEGLDGLVRLTWSDPPENSEPQIGDECLYTDFGGYEEVGFVDCIGQCADIFYYNNWIDDGFCDDSVFGSANLNCEEFDFDGGDCAGIVNRYRSEVQISELTSIYPVIPVFNSRDLISFKIYRDNQELITLPVGTYEYDDLDVINLTSYCYDIVAIYSEGVSLFSNNPVCATPTPGQAPSSLYAYSQDSSIMLEWQIGNLNAEYYTIYREGLEIATNITDLYYEDLTAQNDIDYCYTVSAMYSSGESLQSNQSCGMWILAPPLTFQTSSGNGFIDLEWSEPGVNTCANESISSIPFIGQGSTSMQVPNYSYFLNVTSPIIIDISLCSEITNYDTTLEIFTADQDCVLTSTSYYNDDDSDCPLDSYFSSLRGVSLEPGEYYIVIDGYSGANGDYEISVSQSVMAVQLPPSAIDILEYESLKSGLSIEDLPNRELTLNLSSHPRTVSTRSLLGYDIYRQDQALPIASVSPITYRYTDSGLENGAQYCYNIVARYDEGDSQPTATICDAPDGGSLCPPLNFTAQGVNGDDFVSLDWDIPNPGCVDSIGGDSDQNRLTGYKVYRSIESENVFELLTSPDLQETFYKDYNVDYDESYCYKVKAVYADGDSNPSNVICTMVTDPSIFSVLEVISAPSVDAQTAFEVSVSLSNQSPVYGFQVTLVDSPNILTGSNVQSTQRSEGFEITAQEQSNGSIIIVGYSSSLIPIDIGEGSILTISYTSELLLNSESVTISAESLNIGDSLGYSIPVYSISDTVFINPQGASTLIVGSADTNVGSQITIPVSLSNEEYPVAGFQFDLVFDSSVIELVNIDYTDRTQGFDISSAFPNGTVNLLRVVGFSLTGSAIEPDVGPIINVSFNTLVPNNINLTLTNASISDLGGNFLPLGLESGQVNISEGPMIVSQNIVLQNYQINAVSFNVSSDVFGCEDDPYGITDAIGGCEGVLSIGLSCEVDSWIDTPISELCPATCGLCNMNASNIFGQADILIASNDNGDFYVPSFDVYDIGIIDMLEGYSVFPNGSVNQTIVVSGTPSDLVSINLEAQKVNMLPYLPQDCMSASEAFSAYDDAILIAQDDNGNFYVPSFGVNTFDAIGGNLLCPGEAYSIFLSSGSDIEFSYPSTLSDARLASNTNPTGSVESLIYADEIVKTGISHPIIITELTGAVKQGDELVAYANGEVVGATRIMNPDATIAFAAWGSYDKYGVSLPGYEAGDAIELRLYSMSEGRELYVSTDLDGSSYGMSPLTSGRATVMLADAIPVAYELMQNYPNPFNPSTTIGFAVPNASDVTLNVYDLTGRLITNLVSGYMEEGAHEVVWNGMDASGATVSAGVYFYTLESKDMVMTKKMILMK